MEGEGGGLADGDHAIDVEEVLDVVCWRHCRQISFRGMRDNESSEYGKEIVLYYLSMVWMFGIEVLTGGRMT